MRCWVEQRRKAKARAARYHGPGQADLRVGLGPAGWGWGPSGPSRAPSSWAPALRSAFLQADLSISCKLCEFLNFGSLNSEFSKLRAEMFVLQTPHPCS